MSEQESTNTFGNIDDVSIEKNGVQLSNTSLEEAMNEDNHDETLNNWREQVLKESGAGEPCEMTRIVELQMIFPSGEHEPFVFDLTNEQQMQSYLDNPIVVKQGVKFQFIAKIEVGNEVLVGVQMINATYRLGIKVDRVAYRMGSFAPGPQTHGPYPRTPETMPSGFLGRGSYTCWCRIVDDDERVFLDWRYGLKVASDW
eukprot:TRINITY_DN2221_c0_g1_i1.p1 TRINITY_DN2221_c0_g1~~TRINITY_DN2221_c0_g1_i1.p1  ORF type:complete len:200 (-),score=68.82 TRINITY_DN2221_c0_g1_i1:19-618(-)